jgi:arginyl-tRNA synthetase
MIEKILAAGTAEAIAELYGQSYDPAGVQVQKTRKEFEGDLTVVIFPLTRISRKSPEQTAGEIGAYLTEKISEVSRFTVVKGFLNIVISESYWYAFLEREAGSDNFGTRPSDNGPLQVVEFSSPNTNKPLHLGHIRNNLLGWSVTNILAANGKKVVRVNLVNDRGIHICKSMLAYLKWGNGETPETSGMKGDKLVGKYYVLFDEKLKEEAFDILERAVHTIAGKLILNKNDYKNIELVEDCFPPSDEDRATLVFYVHESLAGLADEGRKGTDLRIPYEIEKKFIEFYKSISTLIKEAQELLRKWENGDPATIELWRRMNSWVYDGFDVTYKRLGVTFDKIYYESETYLLGRKIVEEGLSVKRLIQKADGSIWADLRDEGLDEKILMRADGTSVYMTQDLGTAHLRHQEYRSEKLIYVVGNEQNYHFDVLKRVLKKLGYDWADTIHHLSYGMVELPEGKMKSREGTVVDADDLMDEMYTTARDMTMELGKAGDFDAEEAGNLYRMIGLGALKYFILKVDPEKNMLFDPGESIDFDGNTGPFIQYTHARICSLLKKAGEVDFSASINSAVIMLPEEREIIRLCHDFPAVVQEAGIEMSPALIANYIYELTRSFNTFYQKIPVLKEQNRDLIYFRLLLVFFTGRIIRQAMNLLGIEVPERM